jgi:amidase
MSGHTVVRPTRRTTRGRVALSLASLATASILSAPARAEFIPYEKSVTDLISAYTAGQTTATDIVNYYVNRINTYDKLSTKTAINSVAAINPTVMADAAAIDAQIAAIRAAGGTLPADKPLLGVPVLVKDSYDVAGMTTTNGLGVLTPTGPGSVTNMIAPRDAFSVAQLKAAGAIILGKANMSTMAYSYNGYDDAYGRVLNPYVPTRTPGGSSSGSGAAIASNFAMLAMGGETGGSIRVPSTHNALVGLKTSAGLIDPGGTWPLTPTRDVVGPMAKSVKDVALAMDALVGPSSDNLWNNTPYYPTDTPQPGTQKPASFTSYLNDQALAGEVVAIPKAYIGKGKYVYSGLGTPPPASSYPYLDNPIDPQVMTAFNNAVNVLKAQGATVVEVDIPAYDLYSKTIGARTPTTTGFGYDYPTPVSGSAANPWSNWAAAYYYEKQIESYNDPRIKNLRDLATAVAASPTLGTGVRIFSDWFDPLKDSTDPTKLRKDYTGAVANLQRLATIWEQGNAKGFKDNPDAVKALQAFADLRRDYYDKFMADPKSFENPADPSDDILKTIDHIDVFSLPTLSYLSTQQNNILMSGSATDPTNPDGISYLSLNARFEANILGVPGVTVPMGYSAEGVPMGLEFMGKFLEDGQMLGYAYDYEQATHWRMAPSFDAVPEPAVASLLGSATMGLFLKRRRRTCAA